MPRRPLLPLLKWPLTLTALAGFLVAAYVIHTLARQERSKEQDAGAAPKRAANGVVKLGVRLATSYGIEDAKAREVSWRERFVVYGRVVPNPRATVEVRAAFAGTVRAEPGKWPALGEAVAAGRPLGWVDVRVGPQERLDLLAKLREAQARALGAGEEVKVQQSRVDSLKAVTSQELIARDQLDAALVQLAQAKTQLAASRAAAAEWQKAKDAIDGAGGRKGAMWKQPLTVPLGGQVVELPAAPGMALEAGALVARVVDLRRPLVRVDFPAQAVTAGPPTALLLFAETAPNEFGGIHSPLESSRAAQPVRAVRPRPAPQVDAASQLVGYWYDVEQATDLWRPGLFVKGYVEATGTPARAAVAVPHTALLYHQGRPLVYVTIDPGRYERRAVEVLGRQGDDWVLVPGVVRGGERVVHRRAQVLLSEEFRGDADD